MNCYDVNLQHNNGWMRYQFQNLDNAVSFAHIHVKDGYANFAEIFYNGKLLYKIGEKE